MRQKSERHQGAAERTIKDIRRRTRKRYSSEEKIRRRRQSKILILRAAIEPLRSTRKNAGKSMAAKSGSDVLAK